MFGVAVLTAYVLADLGTGGDEPGCRGVGRMCAGVAELKLGPWQVTLLRSSLLLPSAVAARCDRAATPRTGIYHW